MKRVVVDASVALAWCFPDEVSEYADEVLVALEDMSALVPGIWGLEVANAVLVGLRQNRLRQPEARRFAGLLENLSITEEAQAAGHCLDNVLPLAQRHGLSAYDAAYLELAIRHGVPMATLDSKLRAAARKVGVQVFPGKQV